jgi:hypothetical protein
MVCLLGWKRHGAAISAIYARRENFQGEKQPLKKREQ